METSAIPSKIVRAHKNGNTDIYLIRRSIGKGGFSTVYEANLFRTNQIYAVKAISLDNLREKNQVKNQLEETKIQSCLNHPNILRAYDFFQDGVYFYIILEYCPYQSVYNLFKKHKRLSEIDTADIIKQVLEGVQYLHQNLVIHRDIKPQNLLIGSDGKIKISDFGISTKLTSKNQKCHVFCGTRGYMCPEMIKKDANGYSFESDIWSIGVCTFLFLTGCHPFLTADKEKTESRILNNEYMFPPNLALTSSSKDFISKILQTNPSNRPTISFLLNHPFITKAQKTPHHTFFQILLEKSDNKNKNSKEKPPVTSHHQNQEKPLTASSKKPQEKPPTVSSKKNQEKPPTVSSKKNQENPPNIVSQKNQEKPPTVSSKKNHDKPSTATPRKSQEKLPNIISQKNQEKPPIILPQTNQEKLPSILHQKNVYGHPHLQQKIDSLNNDPNYKYGVVVRVYKVKRVKKKRAENGNSRPMRHERIELPPLEDEDQPRPSRLRKRKKEEENEDEDQPRSSRPRKKKKEEENEDDAQDQKVDGEENDKPRQTVSSSFNPDRNDRTPRKERQQQQEKEEEKPPQPPPPKQQDEDKFTQENEKYSLSLKRTPKDLLYHTIFQPERNDRSPRKEMQDRKPTKLPPLRQQQQPEQQQPEEEEEEDIDERNDRKLKRLPPLKQQQLNEQENDIEMYGRPQPTETLKRKRHQISNTDDSLPQNMRLIPSYCIINFVTDNKKGEIYYFMKNGQVGMISNDQQRLVLDPFEEYIQIWPRIEDYKPDIYRLSESEEYENVSKLLKYARIFKEKNIHSLEIPNSKHPESIPMRHVKYCMNNENGMLFRMDNRVTQINFPDKSKLIVFWEQKLLISAHSLFRNGLFMTFDGLKKSGNEELKKKYSIAKEMIGLVCK